MAIGGFIGYNNICYKITDAYVGVDNLATKLLKGYVGDENNIARLCFERQKTFVIRIVQPEHGTITATYGDQTFTGNVDISGFKWGDTVHITITADTYYRPDDVYIAHGTSELETPYTLSNVSFSGQNLTFDITGYDALVRLTPKIVEAIPASDNFNFGGTTYCSVVMFDTTELAQWYLNNYTQMWWTHGVADYFGFNLSSMSQFGSYYGRPILLLTYSYYQEIIAGSLSSYDPKTLSPTGIQNASSWTSSSISTALNTSSGFITHTNGYGYVIPGDYYIYKVASYDSTYNVRIEVIAPNTWMFKLIAK